MARKTRFVMVKPLELYMYLVFVSVMQWSQKEGWHLEKHQVILYTLCKI